MNANTSIIYAMLVVLAGYIVWDKALPRLRALFSRKSASTQAMIDLAVAINELPKSLAEYGEQAKLSIAQIAEALHSASVTTIEMSASQTIAQAQSAADLKLSIDKLTEAINGDESTKMLAGTLKACEAIATATVELRDEIAAFGKLVRVEDKQYPADAITQPADQTSDEKMMTFIQAIAKGRTVTEATQEATDVAEKKMMFSAVTLDPTQDPS